MKAIAWMGKQKMEAMNVPDPKILSQSDCIA